MTTRRVRLAVLGLVSMLAWSHPVRGQQASPVSPDPRLKVAYQHLHFERLYPAEAVSFIQVKLQNVPRAMDVLPDLATDPRADVRVLVAMLLGELGEPDGAKVLWRLTRDEAEFVRTSAAGAIVRLARMTPIIASWDGLKDERADA